MKLSKSKRNHKLMMNMTPMIDIVFLLIIFFMTVSQITRVNEERLELPKLRGAEDQSPTSLTINVTKEGVIKISGSEVDVLVKLGMIAKAAGADPVRLENAISKRLKAAFED